jgi:hypothetical protein
MTRYDVLVDGSRVSRAGSQDELRRFLAKYREDHVQDDPDAVHVQILERRPLAWLLGGRLVEREDFLD